MSLSSSAAALAQRNTAVGKARSDDPAERRVVTGTAADDDRDLARGCLRSAHHTPGHADDVPGVGVEESCEHVLGEGGCVVEQTGHVVIPQ